MKKCSGCGTTKNVHKVKSLPLPDGAPGQISLTDWTDYCGPCMRKESEKYNVMIEAARQHIADQFINKK